MSSKMHAFTGTGSVLPKRNKTAEKSNMEDLLVEYVLFKGI